MGTPARSGWGPRLLAPLALLAVAIVTVMVAVSSLGGGGDTTTQAPARTAAAKKDDDGGGSDKEEVPKTYTIESGDSLSTIAEKTGVSVQELEQLNPDVDPAALVAGQELKLR